MQRYRADGVAWAQVLPMLLTVLLALSGDLSLSAQTPAPNLTPQQLEEASRATVLAPAAFLKLEPQQQDEAVRAIVLKSVAFFRLPPAALLPADQRQAYEVHRAFGNFAAALFLPDPAQPGAELFSYGHIRSLETNKAKDSPTEHLDNVLGAYLEEKFRFLDKEGGRLTAVLPELIKRSDIEQVAYLRQLYKSLEATHLNELLIKSRADYKAKKYSEGMDLMLEATNWRPDIALLWIELGNGWLGQADEIGTRSRFNAGIASDVKPIMEMGYNEAIDCYQKALALTPHASPADIGQASMLESKIGVALGKEGKFRESTEALDHAASVDPPNAGMYFYNEAVIAFNAYLYDKKPNGPSREDALALVNKVIARDPSKADAYYMKAKLLVPNFDPAKDRLDVVGLKETCRRYLALAPAGAHAQEIQLMLDAEY